MYSASSNAVSATVLTEPISAMKQISELRIGEDTPSAFNPGLSPIGTGRGTEKFTLSRKELLKIYEKKARNRHEEKR